MSQFITSLDQKDYIILQDSDDYAFSQDSVLLANFAKLNKGDALLDLGCGCGILSTLAIIKKHISRAVGIELQPNVAAMAQKSAEMNKISDKFDVICADVKNIRGLIQAESFDKVICNPPYFANPDKKTVEKREISRRESSATLKDFVDAAAYSLKYGGDFWISIKCERLAECISCLCNYGLEPKELFLVYPKISRSVDIVVIKARKGAKPGLTTKTFIVRDEDGNYTHEYKELYL